MVRCVPPLRTFFASSVRCVVARASRQAALLLVIGIALCSAVSAQVYVGGVQSQIPATGSVVWTGPVGVATDSNGNIYVAQHTAAQIVRIDAVTHATTVILTSAGGVNLDGPQQLAMDSSNNLYIADDHNSRVIVYSIPSTSVTAIYNVPSPFAIAVDASENIWVGAGSAIYKVPAGSANGTTISTPTISSGLSNVWGITFDSTGNMYVSDSVLGEVIEYSAPSFTSSATMLSGLSTPGQLFFDSSNNLIIAVSGLNSVYKYLASSGYTTDIQLSNTVPGAESVAEDENGNLFLSAYGGGYPADSFINEISTTQASLGNQNVGTTSPSAAFNFNVLAGTTIGSFRIVDQGVTGLEFNALSPDTNPNLCTTGTYAAATVCSVDVTFAPQSPGLRFGAVQVLDNSGNVLATAYVTGTGQGPQASFSPASQITVANTAINGLNAPDDVAVDASGNIYIVDNDNSRLLKEVYSAGGYTQSVLFTGLNSPKGVAIDGVGNIYIALTGADEVVKETLSGGSYAQTIIGSGLSSPDGVAVDGSGNVYIADSGGNQVFKETLSNGSYTQSAAIGSGMSNPWRVVVDGSGNLYVADTGNDQVVKEIPSGSSYTQSTIVTGLNQPHGLTLDANDNLYIADTSNNRVLKETLSGGSYTQSILVSGLNAPREVELDGSGNLYIDDIGDDSVYEEPFATAPTLSFATTTIVGTDDSTDGPKSVTVTNIGNLALTVPTPATGTNPSFSSSFTNDSSTTCPVVSTSGSPASLAANTSCVLAIDFDPASSGPISGSVALTDNNLNLAGSIQTISLSGTGIVSVTALAFATPPSSPIVVGGNAGVVIVDEVNSSSAIVTTAHDLITLLVTGANGYSQTYTQTAVAGVATFNLSSATLTTAGPFTYLASESTLSVSMQETVNKATPSITLASTPNPVFITASVGYAATVTGSLTMPGGTVTFYDGTASLGTSTLNSSGVATLTAPPVTAGTHSITATYNGSTLYTTATSTAVSELAQDFSITPASSGAGNTSVLPGRTATFNLVVSPLNGATFPAGITLTQTGAPANATVTLSSSSIASGAAATNLTLTVATVNTVVAANHNDDTLKRKLAPLSLALLLLPILGLRRGRGTWQRYFVVLLLLAGGIATSAGLTGCGAASGYFGQSPVNYTITVTGASGALHHSTSLTLTVE
jgi:sugar lactone lactonase YvrE